MKANQPRHLRTGAPATALPKEEGIVIRPKERTIIFDKESFDFLTDPDDLLDSLSATRSWFCAWMLVKEDHCEPKSAADNILLFERLQEVFTLLLVAVRQQKTGTDFYSHEVPVIEFTQRSIQFEEWQFDVLASPYNTPLLSSALSAWFGAYLPQWENHAHGSNHENVVLRHEWLMQVVDRLLVASFRDLPKK